MKAQTATSTVLTADRLVFDLQAISAPKISSDGSRIAYIHSRTERGSAKGISHLWLINTDGTNQRQLTQTGSATSDPAWSPDDSAIAFISKRGDEGFAICVLPLDGGEARTITAHTQNPTALAWSPNGSQLAYTVPVDPENPDEAPRDEDLPPAVRVIRRIDYKQDNRGYLNDVRHQVMVVDVESGERRQLSTELNDHSNPQWSPDGRTIAARVSSKNGMTSVLGLFPVDGSDTVTIGWDDGGIATWAWSRDGSFILFNGYPESSPQTEYYRYDVASGEIRQLTDDLDFAPEAGFPTISGPAQPVWLDDTTALVHAVRHGASGLWTIDATSGDRTEVTRWDATHAGLSVDVSGTKVVQTRAGTDGTGQLVITDRESRETSVILDPNEAFFAETPPAQVEKISVDRDGWTIDAWLYKPADFDDSKQYPLVMDVHGGPHGSHGYTWNLGAQLLASNGILVVAPNPRGSGTYGREFGEAVRGDWGGEDWKDLQAIVDEVESRSYVDADRTGIYGYSYGGYMTSWAIGQTDRFKAAVCGAPVVNMKSFYGTSDIGHVFGENQWNGSPLDPDVAAFMEERSPITYFHNAVTPTLIVHGEADDRCPIGQGEEMFVALLKANVDVEFVRYPGGSHLMLRGGPVQHRVDYFSRVLTWMQKHLG